MTVMKTKMRQMKVLSRLRALKVQTAELKSAQQMSQYRKEKTKQDQMLQQLDSLKTQQALAEQQDFNALLYSARREQVNTQFESCNSQQQVVSEKSQHCSEAMQQLVAEQLRLRVADEAKAKTLKRLKHSEIKAENNEKKESTLKQSTMNTFTFNRQNETSFGGSA